MPPQQEPQLRASPAMRPISNEDSMSCWFLPLVRAHPIFTEQNRGCPLVPVSVVRVNTFIESTELFRQLFPSGVVKGGSARPFARAPGSQSLPPRKHPRDRSIRGESKY